MELDSDTQEKIQELQSYEQTMHNLLIQKQTFQMEQSETENAINEITKTKDDVFKIVGNVMIKSDKDLIIKDLKNKLELINLRVKSIERQEKELTKKVDEIKKEIMKKIK
jgi:prefoldin beta subunit